VASTFAAVVVTAFMLEALAPLAVAEDWEEDVELWEEIDGAPGWAAALAVGCREEERCDDAAVAVALLLAADARVSRVEAGAADEDEMLAAAGLALLARALRE
jgi:hypothetical protein